MKSLTITHTSGHDESHNVTEEQAAAARDALTNQHPAWPLQISDEVTVYFNMRQVTSIAIGAPLPEDPEDIIEDDALDFEGWTVEELKAALTNAGVEFPSGAKKAELVSLAEEHLSATA